MKRFFGPVLATVLLAAIQAASAGSKPVLAHYLPWHAGRPFSADWGWHWTMNHFNPETTNSLGQRQVASWYRPQIGPYDSADPVVLEYHVVLMKLSGIDGVIADWYGRDDHLDYGRINEHTLALLAATRRAGLKFALCYEDRTIQQEINDGYLTAGDAVTHAQQTMLYAQTNFFVSSNYLQWSNRPVLLNYGPQYFKSNSQWQTIFSVLGPANQPAFFTEDIRLPVGMGAFNWPPMWLSQTNNGMVSVPALESYLTSFQQAGSAWPAFISSVFPRFHDVYEQAGLGFTYGTIEDDDGATFRATLTRAMTNRAAMIQLVTWNDFGEGTIIEPTDEFGYRDLGVIQDLRRQHLEPAFPYRTGDLTLARRLHDLRRQHATNALVAAELDRAFTNLVSGSAGVAAIQLTALESGLPLIYAPTFDAGTLTFSIGGLIPAAGVAVESSANGFSAWQTTAVIPARTNVMSYSAPLSSSEAALFLRLRTAPP